MPFDKCPQVWTLTFIPILPFGLSSNPSRPSQWAAATRTKLRTLFSDAILDACLAQNPESRVGCETRVKGNQVVLAGEITTKFKLDYEQIVRDTVQRIGYRTAQDDPVFNSEFFNVTNLICEQSPDIALGVDENKGEGKEQGAGDPKA